MYEPYLEAQSAHDVRGTALIHRVRTVLLHKLSLLIRTGIPSNTYAPIADYCGLFGGSWWA